MTPRDGVGMSKALRQSPTEQLQGSGKSHVAAVSKWGYNQPPIVAKVLVVIPGEGGGGSRGRFPTQGSGWAQL